MSNTNTGNGVKNIFQSITNFFQTDINSAIKHNNTLDYLLKTGKYNVPYAFMGITTLAMGAFTYVTYKDYATNIDEEDVDEEDSFETQTLDENEENDGSFNDFLTTNSWYRYCPHNHGVVGTGLAQRKHGCFHHETIPHIEYLLD